MSGKPRNGYSGQYKVSVWRDGRIGTFAHDGDGWSVMGVFDDERDYRESLGLLERAWDTPTHLEDAYKEAMAQVEATPRVPASEYDELRAPL